MSNKKRRHKVYKGSDAAIRPSVVKVSAVKRNPTHQWYVDHRRVVRVGLIAAAIVIVIILVIIGLIGIITPR